LELGALVTPESEVVMFNGSFEEVVTPDAVIDAPAKLELENEVELEAGSEAPFEEAESEICELD
jgi:hypothetical protein